MDLVTGNTNSPDQTTGVYIKKILAGNIENVRLQLIDACEAVGYDVIEDEPNIIARRGNRGWASSMASADVLDYARTLTIRVKAVSENSTRATFDYLINHPMLNKGEKNVLLQEAKTIAAISKKHSVEKICSVCETESTDDSKFCRKCGAPLTSEQAELEVLRIMAETRAAKTSVVASSVSGFLSTVMLLLAFILNNLELLKPKLFPFLLVLGGLGVLFALITSLFGWNRLKKALEKPEVLIKHIPRRAAETVEKREVNQLPPHTAPASVTEGTTNLLDMEFTNNREKEKVPASRQRNTNDLN